MTNTEEIRIIASDCDIPIADKKALNTFADDYDMQAALLVACQAALIETQQARIAANERILELQKRIEVPKYEVTVVYGEGCGG